MDQKNIRKEETGQGFPPPSLHNTNNHCEGRRKYCVSRSPPPSANNHLCGHTEPLFACGSITIKILLEGSLPLIPNTI